MEKVIIATANKEKLKEMREILSPLGIEAVSMADAGYDLEIEENGSTFEENAYIKAKAVCDASGEIAIADDSGIIIDALDGMPGVYSARFLGHDTPYEIKNQKIIEMLKEVKGKDRSARYVCSIACVFPDGRVIRAEDTFEGEIAHVPAGENGFGYDPIFYLPELGKTAAQLSPEEKNAISHRGKALRKLEKRLKEINN